MNGKKMSFKESLLDPKTVCINWELVPGRGAFEQSQESILTMAECAAKSSKINGVTITDNPGGKPSISSSVLAVEIKKYGIDPILHLTCKDRNRNQIQSDLYALERMGLNNLLIATGDYPTEGYEGISKPVFDIDSVHLLNLIGQMNSGEEIQLGKNKSIIKSTNFFAGAVVSPFKNLEAELIPQYIKLQKKVQAGAKFIITQLGYDPSKFDELKRFTELNNLQVPLIGNIFVISPFVAKLMNNNVLPGCVVTNDLLKALEEEKAKYGKSKEPQLLRAAKFFAILKGLKYDGISISGLGLKYEEVEYIIEKGEEMKDNWNDYYEEYTAYHKDGFYFFNKDASTSNITNIPVNTTKTKKKAPSLHYYVFDTVHGAFFSEKGLFFKLTKAIANAIDKTKIPKKMFTGFEHAVKVLTNDCFNCGDCAMMKRAYVCPMSQCPKQQRNGPCGGSFNGYCEVYPNEKKCVYVRAYDKFKSNNKQGKLNEYIPPCNWNLYRTSSWLNYYGGRDYSKVSQEKTKK